MPEKRSGFNSSPFRGNGGNPPWKASGPPALGERKRAECLHGPQVLSTRSGGPPDSETNIGIQALDWAKPARRRRDRPESMPPCGRHGRRIENAPVYKRTSGKSGER